MKVLALDLSTSTGFAFFEGGRFIEAGTIVYPCENYKGEIRTFKDYPKEYPNNFIECAEGMAEGIGEVLDRYQPDVVVIEEINLARQRLSNKLLDFIHFATIKKLNEKGLRIQFLTTRCWRMATGCYASAEDKKMNSKISRMKTTRKKELEKLLKDGIISEAEFKKQSIQPVKIDGKVIGRKQFKHFAVKLASEIVGKELSLNLNDAADAILLAKAYILLHR